MGDRDASAFSVLLRRHRIAANLSQEALAERAGLSTAAVGALERGARRRPHLETVRLLARALGLTEAERAALTAAARGGADPRSEAAEATPPRPPHNLPADLTRFFGRERERDEATTALGERGTRLLTVTGTAGVGKTRLAVEVALDLLPRFTDGAFIVPLAAVTQPNLVLPAIADALGLADADGLPRYVREKRLLLLLDNFEHVLAAAAAVAELLRASPRLAAIVTSRAALRVRGERELPLEPLPLPEPTTPLALDEATAYAAVALFVDRAQAADPAFRPASDDVVALVEVCRRLDALRLALELAAVRVKSLGLSGLRRALERRLPTLTDGARDLPPRQQTLRAAIAWSHDLLAPSGQALFRRQAVFRNGATVEAASAVAGDVGADLLTTLAALVEQSLVWREPSAEGPARFGMLETVREYALECLETSGEGETIRRRHLDRLVALAEEAAPRLEGPEQAAWVRRLGIEQADLSTALHWAGDRGAGDAEAGLHLAGTLWRYWYIRGQYGEGRRWLEDLFVQAPAAPAAARAQALTGAGVLARVQGEYDRATELPEEALSLRREIGDGRGVSGALCNLGLLAMNRGEPARAMVLYEESLALDREQGNLLGVARTLNHLGTLAWLGEDFDQAAALYGESLARHRAIGDRHGAMALLFNLSAVERARGRHTEATRLLVESAGEAQELGAARDVADCVEALAQVAAAAGEAKRAARWFGTAEALRDDSDPSMDPGSQVEHDRAVAEARIAIGPEAFSTAWTAGRAASAEEALVEARRLVDAAATGGWRTRFFNHLADHGDPPDDSGRGFGR